MAEATYATTQDLQGLIGNLASQRSQVAVDNAIAGASSYVNTAIGRTDGTNVDENDSRLELIKLATRVYASAELIGNIEGQEENRRSYLSQADRIIDKINTMETGTTSTNYVSSSQHDTYPANPNGIIYSSSNPALRKRYGYRENDSYDILINDANGWGY